MKKIYKAQFKINIEYKKRLWYSLWFAKKTIEREFVINEQTLVLAETEDEAVEKFKARNDYWNGSIPTFPWGWDDDCPHGFVILDKKIRVVEDNTFRIETLRNHLYADEFLAYCRQHLIDPLDAIK